MRLSARQESALLDEVLQLVRSCALEGSEASFGGNSEHAKVATLIKSVILPTKRPAVLVRNDRFETTQSAVWRDVLEGGRAQIDGAIPFVGQIRRGGRAIGTGFVVAPGVLITNRHVATNFVRIGPNGATLDARMPGDPDAVSVDFVREHGSNRRREAQLTRLIKFMPTSDPDLALIGVDGVASPATQWQMLFEPAEDTAVVTIGFPSREPGLSDLMIERLRLVFGEIYDVKIVSPGKVSSVTTEPISHDCSTLGGSSGSPIVDIETGRLIGVHSIGSTNTNKAVSARSVARFIDGAIGPFGT
jgi:endonuclease G, mitochondrial